MPTGSWQTHSLPGSVFTWVGLGPFSAFPDFLNAQYLELGCPLSGYNMGPRDMTSWHPARGTSSGHCRVAEVF